MRVLVTWPPHVPSYFNAGHHLPVFSIAAYLRNKDHIVDTLDAGALNCHWREFGNRLRSGGYEGVVIVNEFDVVEGVRRATDYVRGLVPRASIVTVGRLSYQIPGFFRTPSFDAVVASGDYETGVEAALEWVAKGSPEAHRLPGVWLRGPSGWREPLGAGRRASPDSWILPDVSEIPYEAYERNYANDQNKFCGIPQRRELVVPVARGCPIGCAFCDVPGMQGLRERRLSVERTLEYIRSSFASQPFEYVAFYAPTFTLDRAWVLRLCVALCGEPRPYPWKCATTLHHLDEELIAAMGASQCQRISVGIETFEEVDKTILPGIKRRPQDRFDEVATWCRGAGIELNCFVIVGLPGTTVEGTRRTLARIAQSNARARPTVYTPYHRMRADMSERELSMFNRHLFVESDELVHAGQDPQALLDFVFRDDSYATPTIERIPRRTAIDHVR